MASIETISNEYLSSINTLAEKIGNDLSSTREAYQELWYTLSSEEQKQVLDEAIIDPAAVLKYSGTGEEHQFPSRWDPSLKFSWFTRSQLNLFTVNSLRGEKQKTPVKKVDNFSPVPVQSTKESIKSRQTNQTDTTNLLNKLKNKVPILKMSVSEEKQSLVENKNQVSLAPKNAVSKPKTPPPPPPNVKTNGNSNTERRALLSSSNDIESDQSEDIPKTGFDFLDNW